MTTSVTIQAHCSEEKEVVVSMQDGRYGESHILEDGEETTLHAYDDRVISVKERVKEIA